MAEKKQHIMLHKLAAVRGMSDEQYRDALAEWGVSSSTQLSKYQAASLIRLWRAAAMREGKMKPRVKKFEDFSGRDDEWASPAQLRKIDVLWANVSAAPAAKRSEALDTFLYNRFGIGGIGQVRRCMVGKIITALESMVAPMEEK